MTEDVWAAKHKSRSATDSSSGRSGGNSRYQKKNKPGARTSGGGGKEGTNGGTPQRNGRCNKCKVYGHWDRECKKFPKE